MKEYLFILATGLLAAPMALSQPLCVVAPKAILRKGPGLKQPVTWTVGPHMPFMKIGRQGSWYQVSDLDGEIHWIHSSLVSSKISCVAVRINQATLREGPSHRSHVSEFAFAEKYAAFLKLDRKDAWIQVRDEFGGRYWIHESQLWIPMTRARIHF